MPSTRRRIRRTRAAPTALAAAALLAGCGTDYSAVVSTVRDSAGITIVENTPGAAEAVPRWTVGPEPSLRIGVVDGDPAYQFHRLWAGARLSDGRVVVIDNGSGQVRLFGRDGRVVAVQGREGEGPGEYRAPMAVWVLPDDSIAVFDRDLSRVSILHGDSLRLARVVTLKHGLVSAVPAGTLEGGRRLVLMNRHHDMSGPIQPQYADVWTARLDDDDEGARPDSVLRVVHGRHGMLTGGEASGRRAASPIFDARGTVTARGDRIVYGPGDDYGLHVHDPDGRLRRIVRWHGPDRTPDPELVRAYKDTLIAATPEAQRPGFRRWLDLLPVADRTPAHQRVLLDTTGRLWVSRWSPWPRQLGTHWWVFDPDGRMVATAAVPEGVVVLWIGEDDVLGTVRDEVGVEYLVGMGVR